ncbi:hypothetical protein M5689_012120 [Euphorbia peplus]|nr:hypothetical protein M5689_012120 [Euphorbia peplus]
MRLFSFCLRFISSMNMLFPKSNMLKQVQVMQWFLRILSESRGLGGVGFQMRPLFPHHHNEAVKVRSCLRSGCKFRTFLSHTSFPSIYVSLNVSSSLTSKASISLRLS